jgi:hypothetical protein
MTPILILGAVAADCLALYGLWWALKFAGDLDDWLAQNRDGGE